MQDDTIEKNLGSQGVRLVTEATAVHQPSSSGRVNPRSHGGIGDTKRSSRKKKHLAQRTDTGEPSVATEDGHAGEQQRNYVEQGIPVPQRQRSHHLPHSHSNSVPIIQEIPPSLPSGSPDPNHLAIVLTQEPAPAGGISFQPGPDLPRVVVQNQEKPITRSNTEIVLTRHFRGGTSSSTSLSALPGSSLFPRVQSYGTVRSLVRRRKTPKEFRQYSRHMFLGSVQPPTSSYWPRDRRLDAILRKAVRRVPEILSVEASTRRQVTVAEPEEDTTADATTLLLDNDEDMEIYEAEPSDLSALQLARIAICLLGLQFTWTVELAYGTPYLLSLGMTSDMTTLVWLAGPLSGLIVQPLVGAYSDKCTLGLGRRRPFIIAGTIASVLALVLIAFAREMSTFFTGNEESILAIMIAVCAFYTLDFSINMVQGSCRALITDVSPLRQQKIANGYAASMLGMGSVLGYLVGFLDLPGIFGIAGKGGQMKVLCLVASSIFATTIGITSVSAHERPYVPELDGTDEEESGPFTIFKDILQTLRYLPPEVSSVCLVQFFAWIGWFPLLFYCTTWVAQFHADSHDPFNGPDQEAAARQGSLSFLIFSIVAFATSMLLPWLHSKQTRITTTNIWTWSHIAFALCAWGTLLVFDSAGATVILGFFGVCWGIAGWVPWSLLGEYVANNEEQEPVVKGFEIDATDIKAGLPQSDSPTVIAAAVHREPAAFDLSGGASPASDQEDDQVMESEEITLKLSAGMIFGIHNIFVVLPQFVASLVAGVLFRMLEAPPAEPIEGSSEVDASSAVDAQDHMVSGDSRDAIGWVIRLGGVCAVLAAVASLRVRSVNPPSEADYSEIPDPATHRS